MNSQGLNMCHLAAYLKKWKFVTLFAWMLKEKIDFEDKEGFTPFMRMIISGEIEGAKYMLDQGINIDY